MKFSVLLPTRNRLQYLKHALYSVLEQDEDDVEIIISDNFSEEDIHSYVRSLNEPKIKYYRTDRFVSVTENWNLSMNYSSGDWIIMLGDDDCLMKGYFKTIRKITADHPNADFIYSRGFLYAYPNVLPDSQNGRTIVLGNASFFKEGETAAKIAPQKALNLVKKSFNFVLEFTFNMQFATMNRVFVDSLKKDGDFFHSPYPDYYAMNMMMYFGKNIISCSQPIVAVGICPKSFGYYYFNNIEQQGVEFLNNSKEAACSEQIRKILLPGTQMNSSWLLSMHEIQKRFQEFRLSTNIRRYRLLQAVHVFIHCHETNQIKDLWKSLSVFEKFVFAVPYCFSKLPKSLILVAKIYSKIIRKILSPYLLHKTIQISNHYKNIQELFNDIDPANYSDFNDPKHRVK